MSTAVRRCARCGNPAVCTRTFTHTYSGSPTGSVTEEWMCTSCGAEFVIRPNGTAIGLGIVGSLFLVMFVGLAVLSGDKVGLGFAAFGVVFGGPAFVFAYLMIRPGRVNVLDSSYAGPAPPRPIPRAETPRRCAKCGAAASCTFAKDEGRLQTRQWTFTCSGCKREILIDSVSRTFFDGLLGLAAFVGALACLPLLPDAVHKGNWLAIGFGGLVLAGGVAMLISGARRVMNRITNPRMAR